MLEYDGMCCYSSGNMHGVLAVVGIMLGYVKESTKRRRTRWTQ